MSKSKISGMAYAVTRQIVIFPCKHSSHISVPSSWLANKDATCSVGVSWGMARQLSFLSSLLQRRRNHKDAIMGRKDSAAW